MKTRILLVAFALLLVTTTSSQAVDLYTLFKAKVSLTVTKVIPGSFDNNFVDKAETKTLANNDLINLALGRPLGTKVTEVLAVAVFSEGPGIIAAPKSKLVVINPDPAVTDAAKILATVANLTSLDYEAATDPKGRTGHGIGGVQIVETTTGQAPANNKFFSTALRGAAQGKGSAGATAGTLNTLSLVSTGLAGPLHVKFATTKQPTPVDFDGLVIKAKFSVSGKPVATATF